VIAASPGSSRQPPAGLAAHRAKVMKVTNITHTGIQERTPRLKLVLAFAAVYVIWGSTYLAIRYAVETLPPLLFAGSRFVIAGALLYGWARLRGAAKPRPANWRTALAIGGLLLLGGNGAVVLAELSVPSGLTALLIATEPLMIVLLDWARPGGTRPGGRVAMGLALGMLGMFVLIGPSGLAGTSEVKLAGAALLIAATVSWAAGSLYAANTRTHLSPILFAGMQMLAGGALLLVAGLLHGELRNFAFAAVSPRSVVALVYLIFFGSLVAFTAYSWLLRVTPPSLAATYAYVNPIVAVLLGWAFAGESLSLRTMIAAAVIILAVILITSHQPRVKPVEAAEKRPGAAPRFEEPECVGASD
jgi:drug/metabolite transporter (DMT)-like permease